MLAQGSLRPVLAALFVALGCDTRPREPPPSQRISVDHPGAEVSFAIIGDFGLAGPPAAAVSALVHSWQPDFVVTAGDNNYPDGTAETIDVNIGQYYHDFIGPYVGQYGAGATTNRFFPALGNHDWKTSNLAPHLDYFALPGNERYYAVSWGPVDLFVIDSDHAEPDGITADSVQARWLERSLAQADGPWKLVVMHHPPYSSGDHGSTPLLQWPYDQWGATAVVAGHDHHYERIETGGVLYLVNGLGGNPERYGLNAPVAGSVVRFNAEHGALRVRADPSRIRFEFVTIDGKVIDAIERSGGHGNHED